MIGQSVKKSQLHQGNFRSLVLRAQEFLQQGSGTSRCAIRVLPVAVISEVSDHNDRGELRVCRVSSID